MTNTHKSIAYTFSKEERGTIKDKNIVPVYIERGKEDVYVTHENGTKSIHIGIPKDEKLTRRKLIITLRKIVSIARSNKVKKVAVYLPDLAEYEKDLTISETAYLLAVNFEMANFEFTAYRRNSARSVRPFLEGAVIVGASDAVVKRSLEEGVIVGTAVNDSRTLANTPGADMTPRSLADAAKQLSKGLPIKVTILEEKAIRQLKMGGVLGVGSGSAEKPRFIILEYKGGKRGERPIVLVGKGVTFDTGGIHLKPAGSVEDMNLDMSGGSAVISTVTALAKLGVKKNIVGLIPAVENMPSGSSYRPGDILTLMSGTTVEIMNTDAEGRLILADALTYAKRYEPSMIVDVATLTGAAMVALGQRASALFTTDPALENELRALGEKSGDHVWPLPLWDEYVADLKGTFADLANVGKTRYGGAIVAAIFLRQFVDQNTVWAHIDIAPRMTATDDEYLTKGAAGAPVRLLIELIRSKER